MTKLRKSVPGEFVLIVLGVLVALAADSALERRRLRVEARQALEALREDVRSDVASLSGYYETQLERQEAARGRLTTFLDESGPIRDSVQFARDVRDIASYTTLDPSTAAIEELKSTGGLRLIDNRQLRSSILGYYNSVENISEFDVIHRALFLDLYAEVATRVVGGLALTAGFIADESLAGVEAPEVARAEAARALDASAVRASDDLRRLLVATGQPFLIKANEYRRLRETGALLLTALDGELGGS